MVLARRDLIARGLTAATAFGLSRSAEATPAPGTGPGQATTSRGAGAMELALLADAPSTPTGLAISRSGRVFVMMPRFNAKVPITVGEVAPDGSVRPYPSEAANRPDPKNPQASLLHVPNGVFDRDDTLWLLDAGLPEGKGPPVPGGAKLVQIDLAENRMRRVVPLESGITPSSSLNDLRVDIGDGRAFAYITDQGQGEEGAILAVDLNDGRVVRRLQGHASTKSQKNLVKFVEHRPVMLRPETGPEKPVQGGANGIALSPDGRRLYYAPLIGRRLYAVDTASLLDPNASDAEVAAGVEDLGEKGMTGGLTTDAMDRVYLTLQEQNAVARRHPDGRIEVIASDERLIWADTFWITPDRWLYVTAAQVNRRPEYNGGADLQRPPYAILRVRIDADPAG
ncbi:L-dopachrome tautomerase-related protein [Methylobacterium durans]|uniref:SMP-30/gluconolactonase/LRE family protein n=1 Tax=Methylobacterium durans TaxID=2202825 RepID=UPI002AFE5B98|nr:L-dopachrome tautomerase-related protein [Methylobacterium durans]MEA1832788.1 L-dopachrome tautomerase-related protein [Methylobacterium durans]